MFHEDMKQYSVNPVTGASRVLLLWWLCQLAACKPGDEIAPPAATSETAQTSVRVTFPIEQCSVEKFVPDEGAVLSEYSKALMYRLGTGILKQKEGSLSKLACDQGDSFPGWIDFDGNPVSALYGLSWVQDFVPFSPGSNTKLRLWEKRDGEWWEVPGKFEDITVPLSSSPRASTATFSVFSNGSVSDDSARLLKYFGVGIAGKESRVKLKVGDYSGTGIVNPGGEMRVVEETKWSEQID